MNALLFCLLLSSQTTQPSQPSQLEAFSPLPTSLRDLEDRLILRFQVGYEPVFGSFSGETDTQSNEVGADTVRPSSSFLNANLAAGTRGLGLATLNTYFLGTARFDLNGTTDRSLATPDIVYSFDGAHALLFHQIYGELAGFTRDGALSHVFLRGGRQLHFGMVGTTFDGGTLGYQDDHLEIMLRGGRRSAVFDQRQSDPGLMFGGNFGYDFGAITLAGEVTYFQRNLTLIDRDRLIFADVEKEKLTATLAELRFDWDVRRSLVAWARLSFVSPELSHARLGADWQAGPVTLLFDFDQKLGKDLFFDLSGATGYERDGLNATYETFRLNIPDRAPYSDIRVSALFPLLDWLEADVTPGARVVYGDAAKRSPFDATYVTGGAGLHGRFVLSEGNGLEADASYSALIYFRGGELAGTFRDDDMGGEKLTHEASAGVRYTHGGRFVRRRLLGDQTFTFGLSGYLRSAVIDSRLVDTLTDSVYGAIADAAVTFTDYTKLDASYELARDSQIFVPQLGTFHRVRVAFEARF